MWWKYTCVVCVDAYILVQSRSYFCNPGKISPQKNSTFLLCNAVCIDEEMWVIVFGGLRFVFLFV